MFYSKFVLIICHNFVEASKKILQYLAQCSGHKGEVDRVKDRLLQSNPVLEVCYILTSSPSHFLTHFLTHFLVFFRLLEMLKQIIMITHLVLENIWIFSLILKLVRNSYYWNITSSIVYMWLIKYCYMLGCSCWWAY